MPHSDTGRLLIIDDEERFGRILTSQLETRGHTVTYITNGADALLAYDSVAPDLVICDLTMPVLDGMQVLAEIRRHDAAASVILLSGDIDVRTTVRALRAGAEDVQTKPADLDLLNAAIARGIERSRLMRSHRMASTQVSDPFGFFDESPAMVRLLRSLENLSKSSLPVLIVGEPGTGKGTVAEMLHQLSPRSAQPFIRFTCSGLTEQELKEAFVGTRAGTPGSAARAATAAGGTVFLERISDLSPAAQTFLFSVVTGQGAAGTPAVARIVASTEHDLAESVRARTFRTDLYQRIAVLPLAMPSLRSRGEETLRDLASRTVHAQHLSLGRGPTRITEEAIALLASLDWPGNVRQLRHVVEDACIMAMESEAVEPVHLRDVLERAGISAAADAAGPDDRTLEDVERRHIARILALTGGHRTEAARVLGITRTTLYKKMYEYGLDRIGNA